MEFAVVISLLMSASALGLHVLVYLNNKQVKPVRRRTTAVRQNHRKEEVGI